MTLPWAIVCSSAILGFSGCWAVAMYLKHKEWRILHHAHTLDNIN